VLALLDGRGGRDHLGYELASLELPAPLATLGSHWCASLEDSLPAASRVREAELTLRGGMDNNLVHIDIGRLLDRERTSAGNRFARHCELVRDSPSWPFTSGFGTCSAKSVRVKPGEMIVTRSLSPASWRKLSEMARTANFVPE
jgi:hypothetical protein